MKRNYFILFLIFITTNIFSQVIFPEPLSDRIANYNIDIELNTENKLLTGELVLNWKNSTTDTINELQFHLYMNAFKNQNSTFMLESGNFDTKNNVWGWIDIISMEIVGREILTDKIIYIQPDDGNEHDKTVFKTVLNKSIQPFEIIDIKIKYIVKLPEIISRTGYNDDYFFIAQWFPKIGVLEHKGMRNVSQTEWNCHQFHAHSEFYADFGTYNVNITLPDEYIVGTTGVLQKEIYNNNNTRTLTYRAEDVIDFAWTAYKDFMVVERKWQNINVKLLIPKEHKSMIERHFNAAFEALEYFNLKLGAYPYPNLTIVDVPFKGIRSAGMEYPCLVTTISLSDIPNFIKLPESTTIHEIGHNYFMGMLASNEFEEPWLDEGLNSYFEAKIMENYSPLINLFGLQIFDFESKRASYVGYKNLQIAESANYSWEYPENSYHVFAYNKPATFLKTLENLIGSKTMDKIMQTYFDRWKFKHPCSADFIKVVNEIVKEEHGNTFGQNMNWYFQQVLYGTGICDYELASITNKKITEKNTGVYTKNDLKVSVELEKTITYYNSEISISRLGEVKMPMEILINFEDGTSKIENWNGNSRTKIFSYKTYSKIISAKADYLDKLTIDINRNNNSLTLQPDQRPIYKYTIKFLFFLQNILQIVSFF